MTKINWKNVSLNTSIIFNIFQLLMILYVDSYDDNISAGIDDGTDHVAGATIAIMLTTIYLIVLSICIVIIVIQSIIKRSFIELIYIFSLFLTGIIMVASLFI